MFSGRPMEPAQRTILAEEHKQPPSRSPYIREDHRDGDWPWLLQDQLQDHRWIARHKEYLCTYADLPAVPPEQMRQLQLLEVPTCPRPQLPFTYEVYEQLMGYVRSTFESLLRQPNPLFADIAFHRQLRPAYWIGEVLIHMEVHHGMVLAAETLQSFMSQLPPNQVTPGVHALPDLPSAVLVALLFHEMVSQANMDSPEFIIRKCLGSDMDRCTYLDSSGIPVPAPPHQIFQKLSGQEDRHYIWRTDPDWRTAVRNRNAARMLQLGTSNQFRDLAQRASR